MPLLETVFFYLFAAGAVFSSAAVVAFRNPLYSAIALILDFFFFAGLYVLLSAHFMAVVQVLVYGGAIMVLFVFIIMLLNLREEELGEWSFRFHHILALAVGFGFIFFSVLAVRPLVNTQQVEEARNAAATQQANLEESAGEGEEVDRVAITTPSAVPGLLVDLNEPGLESIYQAELAKLNEGTLDVAARKYPTFRENQKFEAPPVLAGKNARGGDLEEPVRWGTIEPISILLVNRFVVPFELTAMLLLAAIVGAVIIAKKRL